jgi:hypothetical protein
MPYATTLTVIHDDDTRTRYQHVRYALSRDGVRVWTPDGDRLHTDVLMTQAHHQRTEGDR